MATLANFPCPLGCFDLINGIFCYSVPSLRTLSELPKASKIFAVHFTFKVQNNVLVLQEFQRIVGFEYQYSPRDGIAGHIEDTSKVQIIQVHARKRG
jgi:hypothetical protein